MLRCYHYSNSFNTGFRFRFNRSCCVKNIWLFVSFFNLIIFDKVCFFPISNQINHFLLLPQSILPLISSSFTYVLEHRFFSVFILKHGAMELLDYTTFGSRLYFTAIFRTINFIIFVLRNYFSFFQLFIDILFLLRIRLQSLFWKIGWLFAFFKHWKFIYWGFFILIHFKFFNLIYMQICHWSDKGIVFRRLFLFVICTWMWTFLVQLFGVR